MILWLYEYLNGKRSTVGTPTVERLQRIMHDINLKMI